MVVKKKSGKFRFTVDLTKLNNIVPLDEFALPKIDNIIRGIADAKYFSIIDLKDGFWQVPLRVSDSEILLWPDL